MKVQNPSPIKKRVIAYLHRTLLKLENKGNADFSTNGEGYFMEQVVEYYSQKKEPVIIFDVGANIGTYSLLFSTYAKKAALSFTIHLFEPIHSSFTELKKKIAEGPTQNIICNEYGFSDSEMETKMYYDSAGSSLASLYKRNLAVYNISMDKAETIKLRRADAYIEEHQIKKIHLMKIDVEGHELSVLRGLGKYLRPDFIDFIQFEYGGCNIDSQTTLFDLYKILKDAGFTICKIMPNHLETFLSNKSMDDYVYANFVAINPKLITH